MDPKILRQYLATPTPRLQNVEQVLARLLPELEIRPLPFFNALDVALLNSMGVKL